jgi:hypothetical protein
MSCQKHQHGASATPVTGAVLDCLFCLREERDRYKAALKEIAGFPPLSSAMQMQNVADEALHDSTDSRKG